MNAAAGSQLSLLAEGLIRARVPGGAIERLDLPQVLAALSRGELLDFVALRPHQQPAWHAFAVALAVLAMEAAGAEEPAAEAEVWRQWLRKLTSDFPGDEPWHLLVADLHQPAFLQAPCPAGREADFSTSPKDWVTSAQALDRLVTAKNHDEKVGKVSGGEVSDADAWLFALVSLQGFTGGLGRGNYGSARMYGAFGSRSQFRLIFAKGSGPEFRREVRVLCDALESLWNEVHNAHMGREQPLALAWLAPWGGEALSLERMHPLGLEVCRRVRLVRHGTGLAATTAGTEGMRFAAKDRRGVVLDPWTPIVFDDAGPKALTATADTLHYRHLTPLLFDRQRCHLPLLAEASPDELARQGGAWLQARVLVGGGGKTDGWLERAVWVPQVAMRRLATPDGRAALRASAFVDRASDMQGKVLRAALLQFVDASGQPNYKNPDAGRAVEPWVDRFQQAVDNVFYPKLFDSLAEHQLDGPALAQWSIDLRDLAQRVLNDAMESLPARDPSRQFARARATDLFRGALRKHFPSAVPTRSGAVGTALSGASEPGDFKEPDDA